MTALVEMLLEAWSGIPSKEAAVFLISMLPVLELRGGLLAASYLGIDLVRAVLICVAGCFLPVPFILLMIKQVIRWMKNFRLTRKMAMKLEQHGLEKVSRLGTTSSGGCLFLWRFRCRERGPGQGRW